MRKLLVISFLALNPMFANAQITTNVFTRVLHLRVNANSPQEERATGFTIGVDGRQYLVTAKHVVAHLGSNAVVGVEQSGKWVNLQVEILRCDDPVDIAVLIPPYQLTVALPVAVEANNILYGQDVYFMGFPYNLTGPGEAIGGFPFALVKRGLLSSYNKIEGGKNGALLMLDGYNNPGFSGGPVIYRDPTRANGSFAFVSVISGFIPEISPVIEEHNIESVEKARPTSREQPWRIQKRLDGSMFEYLDTGDSVAMNTGLVISYALTPAIALIRKHPVGPEEKQLTSPPVLK